MPLGFFKIFSERLKKKLYLLNFNLFQEYTHALDQRLENSKVLKVSFTLSTQEAVFLKYKFKLVLRVFLLHNMII